MADDQVLEIKLAEETDSELTPFAFLDATAAGTPTPGGGSSAALVGALGSALTEMVANLTVGRKKYAEVEDEASQILEQAQRLRQELTTAIMEDSTAFDQLMTAWRNSDLSGEEKENAVELATIHAAEVPMMVARLSRDMAKLAKTITTLGNANAVTDAAAAAVLARSAVQIAGLNVKINVGSIKNEELTSSWLAELVEIENETSALAEETMLIAAQRGGF
jgi:formiminotetrahydrofolate cyclodeaminase